MAKKAGKLLTIFIIGGLVYGFMEILNRGFTHITMGILGGICFLVIHLLNEERLKENISFAVVIFISGAFITSIEFFSGELLNNLLKMNIWSYSEVPLNIDGQICLLFSLIWFLVALFGVAADLFIRRYIFRDLVQKTIVLKKSQITT